MITADLTGKTALVTGGASGIGLAAVELFARSGAVVAMNHLAEDPRATAEIARLTGAGFKIVAAPGDVSQARDVPDMVARAVDRLGRLDILINNAGTSGTTAPIEFKDLDKMTEEFWSTILSTNLLGPFRCSHAAASALKAARGAIVNTASVAGLGAVGSSVAYGQQGGARQPNAQPRARPGAGGARQRGGARPRRLAMDEILARGEEARPCRQDADPAHVHPRRHRRGDAVPRRRRRHGHGADARGRWRDELVRRRRLSRDAAAG
jgi:hypothetical protein